MMPDDARRHPIDVYVYERLIRRASDRISSVKPNASEGCLCHPIIGHSAWPAATVTIVEDDVIETITPKKLQQPPPLFIHNKGRWSEIQKPAVIPDFQTLTALLPTLKVAYHTYSLKENHEYRVVLRGVPKELPLEEAKEDHLIQNLPIQSVHRITNRACEPLDLVLVTANTTSIDNATKRTFFNITSVCSLTGIKVEQPHKKRIPGQCFDCQLYGHPSKNYYQRARCVKCLGDHGTTACTHNKDTDGPSACVFCKSAGRTANNLGYPRPPKRKSIYKLINNKKVPPPVLTALRRAPARGLGQFISHENNGGSA
ncbi:hypothetical protein EVAR_59420_1 [Eumeta japonica]|uniref:Pre-C2HC domain-containing protein n=1 Tax=Eumeta variegata TaxID=151549 RepID=A0A4C1YZB2_EUMVA|nr:hypothetical protein EVAR_59420_1 [Eumeta japonica]